MLYDFKIKRAILKLRGEYDKNTEEHSQAKAVDLYNLAPQKPKKIAVDNKDIPAIIIVAYMYAFAIVLLLFLGILLVAYVFFWRHSL